MDEAIQKSLGLWVEEVVDENAVPAYEPTREALLRLGLGKRHAQKEFMSKALPELEKAAVADSGWADPHIYIGFVHIRNGDNDKAKESLDKASALDPGREETTLLTSYLLASEEKVDESMALLQSGGLIGASDSETVSTEAAGTAVEAPDGAKPEETTAVAEPGTEPDAEPGAMAATVAEEPAGLNLSEAQALQAEGKSSEAASSISDLLSARLGELGFTMKKEKKMNAMERMKLMMQKKQGN